MDMLGWEGVEGCIHDTAAKKTSYTQLYYTFFYWCYVVYIDVCASSCNILEL